MYSTKPWRQKGLDIYIPKHATISHIANVVAAVILLIISIQGNAQTLDTLVDLGKYKLHFNVLQGNGIPIIFESGAGNDGSIWKDILDPIEDSLGATLITYDRAGFGRSGIDTTNLNINSETKDLSIALEKLGYNGQYFLIAHSLGGDYAMAFISKNKHEVIGGVFIDIVPPGFMTAQKAREVRTSFQDSLASIKKQSLGFYYIVQNYENTSEVMRIAAQDVEIPITVICSDKPPFEGTDSVKWKTSLVNFARASKNRKFILAMGSGHYVFIEDPKLVINAIIDQYRSVTTP